MQSNHPVGNDFVGVALIDRPCGELCQPLAIKTARSGRTRQSMQSAAEVAPLLSKYPSSYPISVRPEPGRKELFAFVNHHRTIEADGAGVSDQRKEQIMRSVTYTFTCAAAILATVWQFSAANAQTPPAQSPQPGIPAVRSPQTDLPQAQPPQADMPQAQPPAPANPAASIPNQKLDAAAAAMQQVARLRRDYLQLLEDAPADDQPRILDEAGNAMEKAVTEQGLSVDEFSAIMEAARNDPQVRDKIVERLQAPAQ